MTLDYEIGNPNEPKGHALIYFRDGANPEKVGASYVVILPVIVEISKYIPPFLAGQVEQLGSSDMSSFVFPPAPEIVPSEQWLRQTAESRSDDLLFGGTVNFGDVTSLMEIVAAVSAEYAAQFDVMTDKQRRVIDAGTPVENLNEPEPVDDVNDVMYSMMSEPDLLTELTTLMGRLQYESSGGDVAGARETAAKIRSIGKHMPENRRIDSLVSAAMDGTNDSAKRTQLYLDRVYAMYREDYARVQVIEQEIDELTLG